MRLPPAFIVWDGCSTSTTYSAVLSFSTLTYADDLRTGLCLAVAPRGRTVRAKPLRNTESTPLPSPFQCGGCRGGGGTFCSLALQRNEARALREHGDGLQLLWRSGFDGVGTVLLECIFQGFFQKSNGLCVVVVVNHDAEANDR